MYIQEIHIDGFGIFHDLSVRDIPNGLILFTGENESGKTTLMEFIRTMLFGFARKGSHNDYPPLRGGNHGGKMQVVMQDGSSYTISQTRHGSTVVGDNGESDKTAFLDRFFRGIDRPTFERVFAIGLKELQGLDVLSQENVRTRLLSAGAGLGVASVPDIMRNIDRELNDLIKPRGKQQIINRLSRELKDKENNIKEIQGQVFEYASNEEELIKIEGRVSKSQKESITIKKRLEHIEQLLLAREPWVNLCSAREHVRELGFAQEFPTNGLERFENLKEEIESW